MRTRTARITASVVGISAVCVIALALTFWQDILVQYHVYWLRNDPGHLKEIATAPENSPQRLAITRHLETDDGKERLFDLYLEIHEHSISRLVGLERHRSGGNGVLFDPTRKFVAAFHKEGFDFVMPESEGGTDTESHVLLDSLLPYLVGASYTSDRYADLVFSFTESQAADWDPLTSQLLKELTRLEHSFPEAHDRCLRHT